MLEVRYTLLITIWWIFVQISRAFSWTCSVVESLYFGFSLDRIYFFVTAVVLVFH